jgi:hypothetical protein
MEKYFNKERRMNQLFLELLQSSNIEVQKIISSIAVEILKKLYQQYLKPS